jgi:hypothetical protein
MLMVRVTTYDRSRPVVVDRLRRFRTLSRIGNGDVDTGVDVELTCCRTVLQHLESGLDPEWRHGAADYRVKIALRNAGCALRVQCHVIISVEIVPDHYPWMVFDTQLYPANVRENLYGHFL